VICVGHLLGNFPQAFSHIALVNGAFTVAQTKTTHARKRDTHFRTITILLLSPRMYVERMKERG
jgi:hypothetical protein